MFEIVLYEPEIPANTGSIGRTCVGTATPLHLVGKLGFSLEDKYLKRAGLDYWKNVNLHIHANWQEFLKTSLKNSQRRLVLFSKKASHIYTDFTFLPGDFLVFGSETKGLSDDLLHSSWPCLRIPIPGPIRSLNLSVAVGVVLFEAFRQNHFETSHFASLKNSAISR